MGRELDFRRQQNRENQEDDREQRGQHNQKAVRSGDIGPRGGELGRHGFPPLKGPLSNLSNPKRERLALRIHGEQFQGAWLERSSKVALEQDRDQF